MSAETSASIRPVAQLQLSQSEPKVAVGERRRGIDHRLKDRFGGGGIAVMHRIAARVEAASRWPPVPLWSAPVWACLPRLPHKCKDTDKAESAAWPMHNIVFIYKQRPEARKL